MNACDEGKYPCGDGACIFEAQLCNGISDCPNNSDEVKCTVEHCNSTEYECLQGSPQCIPLHQVCNGVADCPDNSKFKIQIQNSKFFILI